MHVYSFLFTMCACNRQALMTLDVLLWKCLQYVTYGWHEQQANFVMLQDGNLTVCVLSADLAG